MDELQLDLVRSRLLRYKAHRRNNGRTLSWEALNDEIMLSTATKLRYDHEGRPSFSFETLRRFAQGLQTLDSAHKIGAVVDFLVSANFLSMEELKIAAVSSHVNTEMGRFNRLETSIVDSKFDGESLAGNWSATRTTPEIISHSFRIRAVAHSGRYTYAADEFIRVRGSIAKRGSRVVPDSTNQGDIIPSEIKIGEGWIARGAEDSFRFEIQDTIRPYRRIYIPIARGSEKRLNMYLLSSDYIESNIFERLFQSTMLYDDIIAFSDLYGSIICIKKKV